MDNNEIRIVIADQTSDSRLSKPDVENKIAEASAKPKTSVEKKPMGFKNAASSFGEGIINKASGGLYGQAKGLISSSASPMVIATIALMVAEKAWDAFEEYRRNQNQAIVNGFRAGGSYRSGGNMVNTRVGITGKVEGQQVSYRR